MVIDKKNTGLSPGVQGPTEKKLLETGYYEQNFRRLLDHVTALYDDLLRPEEKEFARNFLSLSEGARRLYVRLISRKGPVFRRDRLRYPEVGDLDEKLGELDQAGFVHFFPEGYEREALLTMTRQELTEWGREQEFSSEIPFSVHRSKQELVDLLGSQWSSAKGFPGAGCYTFLMPGMTDILPVFFLLFFGNSREDLSGFILEDLGILRYENYEVRKEDRFFHHRAVVDDQLFLEKLTEPLYVSIRNAERERVVEAENLLGAYPFDDRLHPRISRRFSAVGKFWERQGEWDRALEAYSRSGLPPARERRCRILERLGRVGEARQECQQILLQPANEEEEMFARAFIHRLNRREGIPSSPPGKQVFDEWKLEMERDSAVPIEEQVLNTLRTNGYDGFYSENILWNGLFGLACWDVVFSSVPGVFFHPFQRGPADLFSPDFYLQRKAFLDQRFREIEDEPDWKKKILEKYREKYNTANYLVSWKRLSCENLEKVLAILPSPVIAAILRRMAPALREFSSGFPDLFLITPGEKGFCLAEVKGPGDQLKPNQSRWLSFFCETGIPVRVIRIAWI